jgi:phosphoglycerate kinase
MLDLVRLSDLDIKGKRVLIREDLNVPLKDGRVASNARIKAVLPTIEYVVSKGAKVILMSHLGRPAEGVSIERQREFSLAPVARELSNLGSLRVRLEPNYLNGCEFEDNEIVLLENVRINVGEKSNDDNLARKLATLCDVYVMDAFATSHRAHASTEGVARYAPIACAGPLLLKELKALEKARHNPAKPVVAIVGGSKVSTKLSILSALSEQVDGLIVGGGIANTFLAASGKQIGKSLFEPEMEDIAKRILEQGQICLPVDVLVSSSPEDSTKNVVKDVDEVSPEDRILDIGPLSISKNREWLKGAKTIIWNGPLGVFEIPDFSRGTSQLAASIKESDAFSLAGGGDTLAAIEKFGGAEGISYVSTGGGAFLELLEGKELPAVLALERQ